MGLRNALGWIGIGFAFVLTQQKTPLYASNETTKLLYGVVASVGGPLQSDWMVNTMDPLPVFSRFVQLSHSLFGEAVFYFYFAILMAVFFYSIVIVFPTRPTLSGDFEPRYRNETLLFLAFVLLFFSPLAADAVEWALGTNYLGVMSNGVARQYLVDPLFQNSLFGVLLLLAVGLSMRGRVIAASIAIAGTCTIHSAYLFLGGAITIALMLDMLRRGVAIRRILLFGGLTLILVVPIVMYNRIVFSATTEELQAQAMRILVYERIPHHSLPAVWFSRRAVIKTAVVTLAVAINYKRTIGMVLFVPLILGVVGTLLQVATGSAMLALIAPWRVSVFLVPISTIALIWNAVKFGYTRLESLGHRIVAALPAVCVAIIVIVGITSAVYQIAAFDPALRSSQYQLYSFARDTQRPGELYAVPPKMDELNEFRLRTGLPIVINWKSHPYKDVELLEWYERNQSLDRFYTATTLSEAQTAIESIRRLYSPTAFVIPVENVVAGRALTRSDAELVFRNDRYVVFKLQSNPQRNAG
jgi:hypothetical protein